MEREQEYFYYIFLDDDVILKLVEEGNINPWRLFERSLFHYKTIHHHLPYEERFESDSWWNSQIYLIIKTDVLYHGQIMLDLNVLALNPIHRPYPRMESWDSVIEAATRSVQPNVPNKYRAVVEEILYKWKVGSEEEINQFVYEQCLTKVTQCPQTAPFQWEIH